MGGLILDTILIGAIAYLLSSGRQRASQQPKEPRRCQQRARAQQQAPRRT